MDKEVTLNKRGGWLGWWPLGGWKTLFDPENARIREFLIEMRNTMHDGVVVLDAGAGKRPYKYIFHGTNYESADMPGGFYQQPHDFECTLDSIPRPDCYYDVVLLTQVLEHVPSPRSVLHDIHRILKPGGQLLLTVPLNGPLHGEPWHFFQFTHYGIAQLAEEVGLDVVEIEKVGGAFWNLGKRFPDVFIKLFKQYDPFRAKKRGMFPVYCLLMNLILSPLWLFVYLPAAYIMRPIFYWADRLDLEKTFTIGYTAILEKPK